MSSCSERPRFPMASHGQASPVLSCRLIGAGTDGSCTSSLAHVSVEDLAPPLAVAPLLRALLRGPFRVLLRSPLPALLRTPLGAPLRGALNTYCARFSVALGCTLPWSLGALTLPRARSSVVPCAALLRSPLLFLPRHILRSAVDTLTLLLGPVVELSDARQCTTLCRTGRGRSMSTGIAWPVAGGHRSSFSHRSSSSFRFVETLSITQRGVCFVATLGHLRRHSRPSSSPLSTIFVGSLDISIHFVRALSPSVRALSPFVRGGGVPGISFVAVRGGGIDLAFELPQLCFELPRRTRLSLRRRMRLSLEKRGADTERQGGDTERWGVATDDEAILAILARDSGYARARFVVFALAILGIPSLAILGISSLAIRSIPNAVLGISARGSCCPSPRGRPLHSFSSSSFFFKSRSFFFFKSHSFVFFKPDSFYLKPNSFYVFEPYTFCKISHRTDARSSSTNEERGINDRAATTGKEARNGAPYLVHAQIPRDAYKTRGHSL
ncbi:hypothetical protein PLICRDRAFT_700869 [Plicaturopsis crispa FD-325 SS-3]|nr:hypothetical protein PLICRDRAFT_700869 [Plicaturopsis crispa FD-325 SS-3]